MFEKFTKTVTDAGKTIGEKTKQGSDLAKAKLKISTEERALNDIYCEIGKTFYEKKEGVPCCDEMKELFDKVAEKTSLIESLKSQIRSLKGVVVCENCGADVPLDFDCGKCGAKVVKPEPVPEETAEAVIDHEQTEEKDAGINIEVAAEDGTEESTEI